MQTNSNGHYFKIGFYLSIFLGITAVLVSFNVGVRSYGVSGGEDSKRRRQQSNVGARKILGGTAKSWDPGNALGGNWSLAGRIYVTQSQVWNQFILIFKEIFNGIIHSGDFLTRDSN